MCCTKHCKILCCKKEGYAINLRNLNLSSFFLEINNSYYHVQKSEKCSNFLKSLTFNPAHLISSPANTQFHDKIQQLIVCGVNLCEKCLCLQVPCGQEGSGKHTSLPLPPMDGKWSSQESEKERKRETNEEGRTETVKDTRWRDTARKAR